MVRAGAVGERLPRGAAEFIYRLTNFAQPPSNVAGIFERDTMKYLVACAALALLPACMGSGGDDVDLTPSSPDLAANNAMGSALNDVRAANSAIDLEYDPTVGRVAQIHANDMFENSTVSIFLSDSGRDMGDTLNLDFTFPWSVIVQMVNQGDMTVEEALAEWQANGSPAGSGGSTSIELQDGLSDDSADFEYFGLGKAGSGSDTYWALLIVAQ